MRITFLYTHYSTLLNKVNRFFENFFIFFVIFFQNLGLCGVFEKSGWFWLVWWAFVWFWGGSFLA